MKQRIIVGLKVAVTLGLLGWLLTMIDFAEVGRILARASPIGLGLLLCVFVGFRCVAAYRWYVLLRSGGEGPRFLDVVRWTFVSCFVSTFLPLGGAGTDVARVVAAAREKWTLDQLGVSSVIDRLIGVGTLLLIVLAGAAWSPVVLPGVAAVAGLLLVGLGAAVLAVARQWDRKLVALLPGRLRVWPERGLDRCHRAIDAYRSSRSTLLYAAAVTLGFHAGRVGAALLGCAVLGIEVPIGFMCAAYPIVMFMNMLPISFNGVGVREVSLTYFLSIVGVGTEAAATLGITLSVMNLLASVPAVFVMWRPRPSADSGTPGPSGSAAPEVRDEPGVGRCAPLDPPPSEPECTAAEPPTVVGRERGPA